MTPERWKRIEELYHAAMALSVDERADYLATASPDDPSVRAEVQALLDEPAAEDVFGPAALSQAAAQLVSDLAPDANIGRTIGPYVLDRLLGIGGMGVVYFAHDRKLQRDVAIKILPQAFTGNADRLARFEREARTLAALHHPNICGIYGLEETAGVRYLVLEFVDGDTLADVIERSRSGLEIREALRIGRQIVDALEVAHEKGIVHRDLKPANIKLTHDHIVKVLDFGLAKMTDDRTAGDGHTRDGVILGTAAYMSPEQARGKSVDKRSDIWAFGCIVFEMLTGRLAFAGETDSDIIGKILEREPDWSALPAATPATIRRLLMHCLAKDPKQRLRDIGDAGIELDSVDDQVSTGSRQMVRVPSRVSGRASWVPWVAMAILSAAAGAWALSRPAAIERAPLANAQFSRFTDWEGTEAGAEISPDGNFLAFVADSGGQLALWVSQVGSGNGPVNLTKNLPPLSAPGIMRTLGFTGDGSEVWFTQAGDSGAPKSLMPLTGGTPRPFLDQGATAPSWSPDGQRLVYFTNGNGDPLWMADRTSADPMRIAVDMPGFFATGVHTHNPVWSPDGEWLYFAHGTEPTDEMNVWRVRPSGGTPEQLTALHAAANHIAVVDAHTVLYVARADDGSGPWLWSLDVDSKVSRRVTSGLDHYSSVSASRDGRRIVATVTNPTATLWQVPLLDRPSVDREVQSYGLRSMRAFAPRVAGDSLFYLSGDGVGDGVWRFEGGTASEIWRGGPATLPEPPAASPDGARVAIVTRQQGKLRLSVMSRDGTSVRTLAPSITIQSSAGKGSADWSPDGAWIVVAGSDEQGRGIFKIPVDGGMPVRLVAGPMINPVWSPDGSLIVYGGPVVGGQVPLLGVRPDGMPVTFPDVRVRLGGGHRFLPDGTGLVYLPRGQSTDFWLLHLATKQTRALTSLSDRGVIQTFDVTRDGKSIVFDRLRENSDIVLIEMRGDDVTGRGQASRRSSPGADP